MAAFWAAAAAESGVQKAPSMRSRGAPTPRSRAFEKELEKIKASAIAIMNELEISVSEDSKVLLRERLDEQAKRRKGVENGIQEVEQAIREIERESVSHDEVTRALSHFTEIFAQIPPYQQKDLVKLVVNRVELASDSMKMALYGRVAAVGPVGGVEGVARSGISEWLPESVNR